MNSYVLHGRTHTMLTVRLDTVVEMDRFFMNYAANIFPSGRIVLFRKNVRSAAVRDPPEPTAMLRLERRNTSNIHHFLKKTRKEKNV